MGAVKPGAGSAPAAMWTDAARQEEGAGAVLSGALRRMGLAGVALLALAGVAGATGIPSRSLTCAQAAALVKQKGAVILATSANAYDRYVNDRRYCEYDQDLKPEWIPTSDVAQCFVGYICYEPYRNGGNRGN